ncbi:formylglycine-generating enzyme family protein [Desulfobacter latus]|uniref:SUMF1/EgtB/PvdO family nonheme iron enzyme n=1 Tax=Desulfobacter latus TaxID=2292 RepID=A0A850T2W6_9BACT|nr:SUMF1/EgtB/PvdO family nonheme iron enzyme [Desulfobacter latus]NWH03532.1 SUMF1/EgtB/PvdO family nonheme iron enzyme [Desulfobacter latus]
MANVSITLSGITEALKNLNYRPGSVKDKAIRTIAAYYVSEDSIQALSYIDGDSIIRQIWRVGDDPAKIKSKRRNFFSLKSSINADLKKLSINGLNSEDITLTESNIFDMTADAKNNLLQSFSNAVKTDEFDLTTAADVLNAVGEFLDKIQSPGADNESTGIIEEIKKVLNRLGAGIFDDNEGAGSDGDGDGDGVGPLEDDVGIEEVDENAEIEEIDEDLLDEQIEEIDDDVEIEEIDDDEFEDVEEINEDQQIEDIELDEDEDLETVDEDLLDEQIEQIDDDEFEDVEEINEDQQIEDIELDEDEDLEELEEIDEDTEIEDVELDDDESLEEIEDIDIDEDQELQEVDLNADEDLEELDELDEEELKALEAFRKARELAEQFDDFLGEREKKFNAYVTIPEGTYTIGTEKSLKSSLALQPFDMPKVYMGKYPVTNALFEIFIEQTGYVTTAEKKGVGTVYHSRFKRQGGNVVWRKQAGSSIVKGACWYQPLGPGSTLYGKRNHPVVQISVDDAFAYAAWIGRRLPTEAEWEAAARTDVSLKYPWGNQFDPGALNIESSGFADTTPVDDYDHAANIFGMTDMLGNVMEWTADTQPSPFAGRKAKLFNVAKGGAWNAKNSVSISSRGLFPSDTTANTIGFRCISELFQ